MALSAFKGNDEIFDKPFSLPHNYNLKVFIDAWNIGGLSKYFLNSALITGISTVLVLISASLAAFAFSRFAFKGNKQLLMVFMIGLLLPIQAYFISQNKIFEYTPNKFNTNSDVDVLLRSYERNTSKTHLNREKKFEKNIDPEELRDYDY